MFPTGFGTTTLHGHLSNMKVSAVCRAKAVPCSFVSYFKTPSDGPAREANLRPPALQSSD